MAALQVLMQTHSAEMLATGSTLASNAGLEVSAIATELRQAAQATRQQIAQVRAVMQLVQDAPSLAGAVQLAYRDCVLNTDEVFEAVYRHSEQLTDEALVRALDDLVVRSARRGRRRRRGRRDRTASAPSCGATPTVRGASSGR